MKAACELSLPTVPRAESSDLLTVEEVSRWLNVSVRTVWRWTALGLLPAPVQSRRRCTRWSAEDITRHLESQRLEAL